jgi:ABC-type nitrate/sulfonate/bicarbonate transport system ATPase subunit
MASSVSLDRVSAIVLRDLTLRIALGESVALIGRSGGENGRDASRSRFR